MGNKANKKELLRKLLKNEFTLREELELVERESVQLHMTKEWESSLSAPITDYELKSRIWNKIKRNTWNKKKQYVNHLYYKIYSIAASFLLLLSVGYSAYLFTQEEIPSTFIANTGIQNMKRIILPDGTSVQMGPKSTLTYPDQFTGKQRVVKLSGQGYFDVAKDADKPFIVITNNMEVMALGTAFEIFNYDNRENVETILKQGKISVRLLKEHDMDVVHTVILTPGDKLSFTKSGVDYSLEKVDAALYTAWHKDGNMTFEKESFKNILPRLEQWYGRDIICKDEVLNNHRFTFKIRDESLEDIFFLMGTTLKLKYEKQEEAYILTLKK